MSWEKELSAINPRVVQFSSDEWLCGDGDYASFILDLEKKKIEIQCFSGACTSHINFDIWDAPRSEKLNLTVEEYLATREDLSKTSLLELAGPKNEKSSFCGKLGVVDFNNDDSVCEYAMWAVDCICQLFCDLVVNVTGDDLEGENEEESYD